MTKLGVLRVLCREKLQLKSNMRLRVEELEYACESIQPFNHHLNMEQDALYHKRYSNIPLTVYHASYCFTYTKMLVKIIYRQFYCIVAINSTQIMTDMHIKCFQSQLQFIVIPQLQFIAAQISE